MQNIHQFLNPISDLYPCGEDLTFSAVFDTIQLARIEDDPLLDQGEWITDRKVADWSYIQNECTTLLTTQSKDLRLCFWLCEAMIQRQGFEGIAQGLNIINAVITEYWLNMYPLIEDNDLDQRISLLQWFVQQLQKLPKKIPITTDKYFSFNDFEAGQLLKVQLENNPDLYDDGLPEHKVTAEQYQDALNHTHTSQLQQTIEQLQQAIENWNKFKSILDDILGLDAPAFAAVDQVLERIHAHISRCLKDRGAFADSPVEQDSIAQNDITTQPAATQAAPHHAVQQGFAPQSQNHIQNRQQAMAVLAQISEYFSSHEPHSPVSYMLKKTIKWANMPLHEWLAHVVKNEEPLASLNDMLGISNSSDDE